MTKTLYLVRHAQASDSVSPDLYRPLTPNGMIDATRMSRHLSARMQGIQQVITSHSERTQMTARIFIEQLGLPKEVMKTDELLYESATKNYLSAVNNIEEKYDSVMLVGHNPSISYFAEYLCHEEFGSMPTCAVIGMSFENLSWAEVSKRTGTRLFYDSPDSILGVKFD